jgi:hypothetical protein
LLTDFVCLYTYEFWLSLCKIVLSSVILLLPLYLVAKYNHPCYYIYTLSRFRKQKKAKKQIHCMHIWPHFKWGMNENIFIYIHVYLLSRFYIISVPLYLVAKYNHPCYYIYTLSRLYIRNDHLPKRHHLNKTSAKFTRNMVSWR